MMNKGIIFWAIVLFWVSATAQLQDSPWPMFHHDLRHTGTSPYLGPDIPTLKWCYRTVRTIRSSAAVGADGTIYVGCCSDTLYAFNPDGTLKWGFPTTANIWSSPAVGADGTVYVGSLWDDCNLYAIDSAGSLKWSYPTGGAIYSSPAIGPDGTVYVGTREGSSLYAINSDGTLRWTFPAGGPIYSSPAVAADSTIYVGSDDYNLYAINPDGTFKWSYPFQGRVRASPAIGSDGTIYINPNQEDIGLYAINPDGTLKWICDTLSLSFEGSYFTSSPAIDPDGAIYVGADHPRGLFAINPDGTLKWMCPITHPSQSSPAVDASKTAYIGCATGYLYAVDSTGALKWEFLTTPRGDIYTSPTLDDRRTVYFGTAVLDSAAFFAIGFLRDVGPISITDPAESVYVDSTYSPQAVVKNMGDTLESFDVECIIDTADQSVYGDTLTVLDLPAGDTALVTFENWTVGPEVGMTYVVTVPTLLGDDYRPQNDTLSKVAISFLPPGVEELGSQLSTTAFQLLQNHPNPCREFTTITYQLPAPSRTYLRIYDVAGRLLRTLVDERQEPGRYSVAWDGRDGSGNEVTAGIYFYRLAAGDFISTRKMLVLR